MYCQNVNGKGQKGAGALAVAIVIRSWTDHAIVSAGRQHKTTSKCPHPVIQSATLLLPIVRTVAGSNAPEVAIKPPCGKAAHKERTATEATTQMVSRHAMPFHAKGGSRTDLGARIGRQERRAGKNHPTGGTHSLAPPSKAGCSLRYALLL